MKLQLTMLTKVIYNTLSNLNFSKIFFADFSANKAGPNELLEINSAIQTSFFVITSIPVNL